MKVNDFLSVSVASQLYGDATLQLRYRKALFPIEGIRPLKGYVDVLGPQDFCWNAAGRRHWIWVRSFETRGQTWRWRFFLSKRGPQLEIESTEDPEVIRTGIEAFLECWE